jgi:NAD+ kinase
MKIPVAVVCNPLKPKAKAALGRIVACLKKNGARPIVAGAKPLTEPVRFAVSLGGDGTLLNAAKLFVRQGVPLLGVNVGHLGFLAATHLAQAEKILKTALSGGLTVEERLVLQVCLERRSGKALKTVACGLAVNDCYLHAGSSLRAMAIDASLDGQFLTRYFGDGVIIATPTGSTAYSLAAGGPIVSPSLEVVLLTPICPHTLAQRPLVLPAGGEVRLSLTRLSSEGESFVSLDGQERFLVQEGDSVVIRRSELRLKLLTPARKTFHQVLREKLAWGQ